MICCMAKPEQCPSSIINKMINRIVPNMVAS